MKFTNSLFSTLKSLLLILLITACTPAVFKAKWAEEKAPEYFKARFETTKGNFDIEAYREWSPAGVDRLYQLIKTGFYTDIALYRVVPDFVVQFGISNDTLLNSSWRDIKVADEPVVEKNLEGTISFARGGVETRSTQIFINLKSNSPYLDETDYAGVKGFPVIARVTSGMDVVKTFNQEYGGEPAQFQGKIMEEGNKFLKEKYPNLDYITKAYLLKK